VIDVRDDAKIARQLDCHGSATMRARVSAVNCGRTLVGLLCAIFSSA
jgi:hypothetical protein